MSLAEWIKQHGRALGFDRVGIAPATDFPELALFSEWKERGYAGELDYLANPKRADVRELLPDPRSVICCALVYDTNQPRSTEVPPHPGRGWISRYAWGDDYHSVLAGKLEVLRAALAERVGPGFEGKLYVDTGPVLERVYGKHAGLGWQGKNTCLLDNELGSFFFLGVLVTNLELAPDTPLPDGCGSCTLCLEACPTGAIVEPYLLDARRCLSYLTIELRGPIPEEFRPALGRHVFGCDICQDVCPYNRRAWVADLAVFQPRPVEIQEPNSGRQPAPSGSEGRVPSDSEGSLFHPRLDWLASLTEKDFRRVFQTSAVKRAKWRGLLRNVLVAMGNSGNRRFRPLLEKFAASDDSLLAEHARWGLTRLAEVDTRQGPLPAEARRSEAGR
ncbi:MAG: tRNA epoxyqueuosine(34) reductase QueG [Acidobacteria bacterium]|nr:tRNA epoxyqueuosine(34) reductase QueG [Acidobacteriota bacterium]